MPYQTAPLGCFLLSYLTLAKTSITLFKTHNNIYWLYCLRYSQTSLKQETSINCTVQRRSGCPKYKRFHRKFKRPMEERPCQNCVRHESYVTILAAKRESSEGFCSSLNRKSNISKVWSVVRSLSGFPSFKPLPNLICSSGAVHSDKAKADVLSETFAAVSKNDNYSHTFLEHRTMVEQTYLQSLPLHNGNEAFNLPFTMAELIAAVQSRRNSSPGKDRVCYIMMKKLSNRALTLILNLFNTSWAEGVLPTAWKHAIVIPLLKKG